MKKMLIVFLLLGYSSMAHADNWVLIGVNDNGSVEIGDWWLTNDRANVPVVAARFRLSLSGSIFFEIDYVSIKDCEEGAGTLVVADLHGNAKKINEFVYNGGNFNSTMAETLCALAMKSGPKM